MVDKKNILQIFSNRKVQICSVLLAVCVIFLIVLKVNSSNKTSNSVTSSTDETIDSYEKDIEQRIQNIVNSISGVTNVKCLVYTKNSIEIEYFIDSESETKGDEIKKSKALTFQKSGSTNEPVIIKKTYPKIEGILVVAKGVEDEKVRVAIINALASVFDINIANVEVLRGS